MDWKFSPSDVTSFNLHLYKMSRPKRSIDRDTHTHTQSRGIGKMRSNGSSKSVIGMDRWTFSRRKKIT